MRYLDLHDFHALNSKLSTKLKIVETMDFEILLIYMFDKILEKNDFSLLRNEASFKWLLISKKQVNNELGVSLLPLSCINFSNDGCIGVKNMSHKIVP